MKWVTAFVVFVIAVGAVGTYREYTANKAATALAAADTAAVAEVRTKADKLEGMLSSPGDSPDLRYTIKVVAEELVTLDTAATPRNILLALERQELLKGEPAGVKQGREWGERAKRAIAEILDPLPDNPWEFAERAFASL